VPAWLVQQGAQRDFVEWSSAFGADVGALWQACPRGDWLLALAARLNAEPSALVLAACACAEGALDHLPPEQTAVVECLSAIRSWAEGSRAALSMDEIEALRTRLEAARDGAQDQAQAEAALAALAALETIGDPAYAASAAAFAAQATMVSASDCAMMEALRFAQHQTAQSVRAVLPDRVIAALWSERER
jgi:hypothetical protein